MTADPEELLRTFVGTQIINNALVKGKADKSYVDELVSSLTLLDVKKVDVLPTTDISTSTIYIENQQQKTMYMMNICMLAMHGSTSEQQILS